MNIERYERKIGNVKFGSHDMLRDYGVIMTSFDIGMPSQKRSSIEVPGMDGVIDLTYVLSEQKIYDNRTVSISFEIPYRKGADPWDIHERIANDIHGNEMDIRLSFYPGWHLEGNASVDGMSMNDGTATFKVTCDCNPYFIKNSLTRATYAVSGTMDAYIRNATRWTIPSTEVNGTVSVKTDDAAVSLSTGKVRNAAIVLKSGINKITLGGSGTITFEYQEARL